MELELAPQVKQALGNRWEPIYRSQLHYLVTWSTRGRRPVLKERHIDALKSLIRTTCEERDFELAEPVREVEEPSGPERASVAAVERPQPPDRAAALDDDGWRGPARQRGSQERRGPDDS